MENLGVFGFIRSIESGFREMFVGCCFSFVVRRYGFFGFKVLIWGF